MCVHRYVRRYTSIYKPVASIIRISELRIRINIIRISVYLTVKVFEVRSDY